MLWVVDGNNVMGAGADGWWNDPLGAAERLAEVVAGWCRGHEDTAVLVFDGRPEERLSVLAGGNLEVDFARRAGRDAADDRIVEVVEERYGAEPELTVVTSDKGLRARLPPGVVTEGAGGFRERIGLPARGGGRRR